MSDDPPSASRPSTAKSATPAPKIFKPRAGIQRKTKAEREKIALQEQERLQARASETTKNVVAVTPSTRGGRASRGRASGPVNREERTRGDGTGGGVFGAGSGMGPGPKPRASSSMGAGYSEILDGQEAPKVEGATVKALLEAGNTTSEKLGVTATRGAAAKSGASKAAEVVAVSSDEDFDGPKRDIERIWISSDEGDQDIISRKGKQKVPLQPQRVGAGLRPVRAPRSMADEDEELVSVRKKSTKPSKKPAGVEIYEIDADDMDIDEPEIIKELPSSPELRKKTIKKTSGKGKETRIAAETVEERAERIRLHEDIEKLRREFEGPVPAKAPSRGDDAMDTDETERDHTGAKLFLFQFPPLTPFLIDPMASVTAGVEVKQESAMDIPAQPPAAGPSSSTATAEIKKEPDTATKAALQIDGLLTASEFQRLPAGLVGKLRVHKSGKVSLDWGGTDMEVRYGTEVDFLQDAVLVETAKEGETGLTYALGQVQKKMVVIPDWAKLYD